jgi:hypothetical protein
MSAEIFSATAADFLESVAMAGTRDRHDVRRAGRNPGDIEDEAALAGGQVEFVSVLNLTAALPDGVGVRLEQADELLAGRYRLVAEDPALALGDDARDQRQIMVDRSAPALGPEGSPPGFDIA